MSRLLEELLLLLRMSRILAFRTSRYRREGEVIKKCVLNQ